MLTPLLALMTSLSELVFLTGPWAGGVMLVMVMLVPGLALGGLSAWCGAWGCARLLGQPAALHGGLALNPLLTGLAIGHLLAPGWECVVAAAIAGAMTWFVAVALTAPLRTWFGASILSLPFVIVTVVCWLALIRYPALTSASSENICFFSADLALPVPPRGFLNALGALLFLPLPLIGAVIAGLIVWQSRILFGCAVLGWFAGVTLRGCASGQWYNAWTASDGFNAMLTTMAIGGVFLVPSLRSLTVGVLAALAATITGDALSAWSAWGGAGIPVFTMPFIIATVAVLAVLTAQRSPLLAAHIGANPEATLAEHWSTLRRFPGTLRTLAPPFAGTWTVWQGHDGPWTHRGLWRCALDFVICDAAGNTHANDGDQVSDYYAFGQPVLSPIAGQVITVIDGIPDNQPGHVDQARPWGNLVVIHDQRGFFVELSHFACGSVAVQPGQFVTLGQLLGRCGNSGHSPQPHLHLQVQAVATVGAATLPFSLAAWWDGERYQSNAVPQVGRSVQGLHLDAELDAALQLRLGDVLNFDVEQHGQVIAHIRWEVGMSDEGGFFLRSPRGRLHVGRHEGTFYTYRNDGSDPWLRLLWLALPRMPLCRHPSLTWDDHLPVTALGRSWRTMLAGTLALIWPRFATIRTRHHLSHPLIVCGEILMDPLIRPLRTQVACTPNFGLVTIQVGDLTLRRIPTVSVTTAEARHAAA